MEASESEEANTGLRLTKRLLTRACFGPGRERGMSCTTVYGAFAAAIVMPDCVAIGECSLAASLFGSRILVRIATLCSEVWCR
jgi:hypothetical protein